jgi:hypothetical protein
MFIITGQMAYARPNGEAISLFDQLVDMKNDKTALNQFVKAQKLQFEQVRAVRLHLSQDLNINLFGQPLRR